MTPRDTTADRIRRKCDQVAELLVAKNQAYGDSALNPVGIFGRGKASDLIRVRIDDKLSRIKNAPEAFGEGYLVLLSLAIEDEAAGGDRRGAPDQDAATAAEPQERPRRPDPGWIAGVGLAEADCRR